MAKIIEIHCEEQVKEIFTTAISRYAELAYPKESKSECNQAARESLITAVEQFEASYQQNGFGILSRRLRAMVKAALETYHLQQEEIAGHKMEAQRQLLFSVAKGTTTTDQELINAMTEDKKAT
ncbi:MAG: hypothetical protein HOM11_02275 [Methylococcales bacterium]|jgi:hypothetical protein|nr:hypothetical protein [Methylococcales bacterium]MBT7443184.1 hypothetical protein [Methylococcales bacterium]